MLRLHEKAFEPVLEAGHAVLPFMKVVRIAEQRLPEARPEPMHGASASECSRASPVVVGLGVWIPAFARLSFHGFFIVVGVADASRKYIERIKKALC